MQINNHFSPASLGHGSRPDHAGGGQAKGPQFQPATADAEPATTTDTTNAVAPTEEAGTTEGPGKSSHSVAHRARAELAALGDALGGFNFGWLVSQIARNEFNPADYAPAPDGEGEGDTGVIVDEASTEVVVDGDETPTTGEAEVPTGETAGIGDVPDPVIEEDPLAGLLNALNDEETTVEATTDPVVDLVGSLLEEGEDETDAV